MRILFVHEVNYATKVVFEMHDFPELLSQRGHDVVFVDFPEDEDRKGLKRLVDLTTRVVNGTARAHDGPGVEVRTPGRVLPPPFDRLVASVTHVPEIRRLLRRGDVDVVVLYGVPTNGWQTVRLAARYGVPVVFRSIDVSHQLRSTPFTRLIELAERSVVRRASWVSTHNVALRNYLVELGADPDRSSVEYPGLDLERFEPGPRPAALAARHGIEPEHRVALFMGTLYRFAGLDWFIEEFAQVLAEDQQLRLVLVGGGEFESELRATAKSVGAEDSVIFTGFADYQNLADHLRLGDVAINPFPPQLVTNCALPGKVLQYLGCGLPTVCTPLLGLQGMLEEGEGVLYREPGAAFVDAVVELLHDTGRADEVGASGRASMERLARWDTCLDLFEARLREVASQGHSTE